MPEAALDRFDLGGRNEAVPVASKTVKSTDVAMQTTADPAAVTAPGCSAGRRRDTRLVAACRCALNADRFRSAITAPTALLSAFMRCMVLSQSGMPAISSMSPDPAITFRRSLA